MSPGERETLRWGFLQVQSTKVYGKAECNNKDQFLALTAKLIHSDNPIVNNDGVVVHSEYVNGTGWILYCIDNGWDFLKPLTVHHSIIDPDTQLQMICFDPGTAETWWPAYYFEKSNT